MVQHTVYLIILTIAFTTYMLCAKSHYSLKIIPYILGITLATEAFVNLYYYFKGKLDFIPIYHLFIPLEYSLLCIFFSKNIQNHLIRKLLIRSIFVFLIVSLSLSWYVIGLQKFPGHNYNIEGVLLCGWSIITLFHLEINTEEPIYKLPIFWICLGILVFHLGIFTLNGVYNKILVTNREVFNKLRLIVEKSLNIFLYSCYFISALCSHRMMKS